MFVLDKSRIAVRRRCAIALFFAVLSAGNTTAQTQGPVEPEAEPGPAEMDPITVLGSIETSAQAAARLKAGAPNAMEVIDAEQLLQFNEQALGDALRRLPGVTFDGANRAREVRLRGLPGESRK